MSVMTNYMRDMSRTCQRGMSRYTEIANAGIIPQMENELKSSIMKRIEDLLKKRDISPRKAGIDSGLGADVIRDWRRSKAFPRLDTLVKLAPVLNTTPEWLAFATGDDDGRTGATLVPDVSWVAASRFAEVPQELHEGDHPRLSVGGLPPGKYMALTVVGDSMNIVAPENAKIIVDLDDRDLLPRRFYVFVRNGEATFKRYMVNPEQLAPYSSNPVHEPISIDSETTVIGRAVKVINDL